ncbi:MAG: hypothetical protein HN348_10815 [Proteobacteria bacterium]|nr:hypothetical protein [Pseudomonadota bacterium]
MIALVLACAPWVTDAYLDEVMDRDGDGDVANQYGGFDCNDFDGAVSSLAPEVCDDGIDNNCDGRSTGCGLWGDFDLANAEVAQVDVEGSVGAALTATDLNDNSQVDLVVGAPEASVVYAYYDGANTPESLVYTKGVELGSSLAVGHLNGDGSLDLAVSAPSLGGATTYLFHGPFADVLTVEDADTQIIGDANPTVLIGDLDGKGAENVVLACSSYSASSDGAVLLYPDQLGAIEYDFSAGVFGTDGSRLGTSAFLADVDADGVMDLVAGAPGTTTVREDAGAVYLAFGAIKSDLYGDFDGDLPIFTGTECGVGQAVWAGDLNDDGYVEVVAGAPLCEAGTVWIADSKTLTAPGERMRVLDHLAFARIGGGIGFGSYLWGDDFDGDGLVDLVVGTSEGQIYVFSHSIEGKLGDRDGFLIPPAAEAAQAIITGNSSVFAEGMALASGDFIGDELKDLVVGAPGWNDSAGRVFLLAGSPGL